MDEEMWREEEDGGEQGRRRMEEMEGRGGWRRGGEPHLTILSPLLGRKGADLAARVN